jgi:hypothetical protein
VKRLARRTNSSRTHLEGVTISDQELTAGLAKEVMGWKVAPDRFIKPGRSWVPRWRFAPLKRLEDAFEVLDRAKSDYKLTVIDGGSFTAEVRVGGRIGKTSGEPKARTITIALAHALGLEVPG